MNPSEETGFPVEVEALLRLVKFVPPPSAAALLFTIILGRTIDQEALDYYSKRFAGSDLDKEGVIIELLGSAEARTRGLFGATDLAKLDPAVVKETNDLAVGLAACGLLYRRVLDMNERIINFEEIARLTLLSMPEVCGKQFDQLQDRIARLEEQLAKRQVR